jgi:S-DNA-T family DNA segregation ATPase FtsK/SpoIIIE
MRANALFSIKGKIDEEQVVQLSKTTVAEETTIIDTIDPVEDVVLDTEDDAAINETPVVEEPVVEETPVVEESVVEETPLVEPNGEDGVVE